MPPHLLLIKKHIVSTIFPNIKKYNIYFLFLHCILITFNLHTTTTNTGVNIKI